VPCTKCQKRRKALRTSEAYKELAGKMPAIGLFGAPLAFGLSVILFLAGHFGFLGFLFGIALAFGLGKVLAIFGMLAGYTVAALFHAIADHYQDAANRAGYR
jgi:hypothetical protein